MLRAASPPRRVSKFRTPSPPGDYRIYTNAGLGPRGGVPRKSTGIPYNPAAVPTVPAAAPYNPPEPGTTASGRVSPRSRSVSPRRPLSPLRGLSPRRAASPVPAYAGSVRVGTAGYTSPIPLATQPNLYGTPSPTLQTGLQQTYATSPSQTGWAGGLASAMGYASPGSPGSILGSAQQQLYGAPTNGGYTNGHGGLYKTGQYGTNNVGYGVGQYGTNNVGYGVGQYGQGQLGGATNGHGGQYGTNNAGYGSAPRYTAGQLSALTQAPADLISGILSGRTPITGRIATGPVGLAELNSLLAPMGHQPLSQLPANGGQYGTNNLGNLSGRRSGSFRT